MVGDSKYLKWDDHFYICMTRWLTCPYRACFAWHGSSLLYHPFSPRIADHEITYLSRTSTSTSQRSQQARYFSGNRVVDAITSASLLKKHRSIGRSPCSNHGGTSTFCRPICVHPSQPRPFQNHLPLLDLHNQLRPSLCAFLQNGKNLYCEPSALIYMSRS